ncbi:MAG: EFR1 family ferrodoxin [Candidatus Heimdallarchaeota archaeon]|nr:EFR1 family ferrodoxin [Candidatus Heimdallarchaeota archaeon]
MKIAILYFTGTGTTAKFAYDIAEGIKEENQEIELIRLKKGISFDADKYELIGIGSPAYSFRAPRLTTQLLKKIDFKKKPIFVFCTSGGMPGNALWNLYFAVKKKADVCLGFDQGFGATNLRSWMPKKESSEKLWGLNDYDCNNARSLGKEILRNYKLWSMDKNLKERKKWTPKLSFLMLIWSLLFTWRWMMAATVGRKFVDKEKCMKCQKCAIKICPSGAITLSDEKYPLFNERQCIGCNGCINLCPEDAIWSKSTKKHKQYNLYKDYILK